MTREAFLAASRLDKLAEMESVRASPSRLLRELLGSRVERLSHLPFIKNILQICVTLICLHKKWRDNVQILVQFQKSNLKTRYGRRVAMKPIRVDLSSPQFGELKYSAYKKNFDSWKKLHPENAVSVKQLNQIKPSKHKNTMPNLFLSLCRRGAVYARDHEGWRERE